MTAAPVLAATAWPTNAAMIADAARLGYLRREWRTLDPTYGRGTWWREWRPDELVASDINPELSPAGESVDFTALPHGDRSFQAVVLDAPYKLNGTPSADVDERYGVHVVRSREGRHELIRAGITECARVLDDGYLLLKCQDQVNGGRVRWQTDLFTRHAESLGLEKVDALLLLAYRAQPEGRSQQHARRNLSTLLVFRRR